MMTPGVRTEPELTVRIVERERRLFVLEDEHYEGSIIGTRQLKADGSWTGWSAPCDVVDETYPVHIGAPLVPNPFAPAQTTTWTYPTTTASTTKLATTSYVESTSMMTVNPAMLATITSTS